jgi:hypothetical protein
VPWTYQGRPVELLEGVGNGIRFQYLDSGAIEIAENRIGLPWFIQTREVQPHFIEDPSDPILDTEI